MNKSVYTWIAFHGITDILLPLEIWLPFYIISPPNFLEHIFPEAIFGFDYSKFKNRNLRLIGNLPYNISTPLLFYLLSYKNIIKNMFFMLQKEVVERICARPGTKEYGRLSVMIQHCCEVESMLEIKPDAFYPSPNVDSAIVKITPLSKTKYKLINDENFKTIVREAFSQRRKTIRNALKMFLNEDDIKAAGIDANVRAEKLEIKDFVELSNLYQVKN